MAKTIHFICGLPRSGATLLCNILAQNPRFHVTSPPGVLELLFLVRHHWNRSVEFKATPNEPGKLRVLKGVLESYFAAGGITQPVLFDKSRAWLGMIEMAEALLEREVKLLVPVRDVRDLLGSFEHLWRNNPHMRQVTQSTARDGSWETVEGRCDLWVRGEQPIGLCYNRIRDALLRGYRNRLHFVEYELLCRQPAQTISRIYAFLDEPEFDHDFQNVQHATWDVDEMYQVPGLPRIRSKVEPAEPRWPFLLGQLAAKYAPNNHLWQQFQTDRPRVESAALVAAPNAG